MKKSVKKLARLAEQYHAWAVEESLPLWWKSNRLSNGAFYEALDFEGRPVPEPQARVRVQARQVYALALGWKLGFRKKSLPAKLERSILRFLDTCLGPEGLPGRIVNVENGELVDPRPELYNTGFALMALAQSRKVLGGRACGVYLLTIMACALIGGLVLDGWFPREFVLQAPAHAHEARSLVKSVSAIVLVLMLVPAFLPSRRKAKAGS